MHKDSLSVALEDFNTLSINLVISTLISERVFIEDVYSAECRRLLNSVLNLKNPSLGFPGDGLTSFSEA